MILVHDVYFHFRFTKIKLICNELTIALLKIPPIMLKWCPNVTNLRLVFVYSLCQFSLLRSGYHLHIVPPL